MRLFTLRRAVPLTATALLILGLSAPAGAGQWVVGANADAFQTLPGNASITLPAIGAIPLEGAEFTANWGPNPYYPLTTQEALRLNALAPNLGIVSDQLVWVDPHGSVVSTLTPNPHAAHAVAQELIPVINTRPNFDTVVERMSTLVFTNTGVEQYTQTQLLMLNLQSVNAVVLGGFHYGVVVLAATDGPVVDSTITQYKGNLGITANNLDGAGTLDMGVTGPTPSAGDLGANLPSGMLGLPVSFDIQFIPLDGGPAIPDTQGEVIFQNPSLGTIQSIPEPSSFVCLLTSSVVIGGLALRRARAAR